jgi:hypothetical protein
MKPVQRDFFQLKSDDRPHRISHGGSEGLSKRKLSRPLDRRKPVHVVMKSSLAKGALNFLNAKNKLKIDIIIRKTAKQFGITIHEFQNMGNHFHFILKFSSRDGIQNFLRSVPALVARLITGARRGKHRPSRLLEPIELFL